MVSEHTVLMISSSVATITIAPGVFLLRSVHRSSACLNSFEDASVRSLAPWDNCVLTALRYFEIGILDVFFLSLGCGLWGLEISRLKRTEDLLRNR